MYRKYVHWVPPDRFADVSEALSGMGARIAETGKAACLGLSKRIPLAVVTPKNWDRFELCKRQFSWYWASRFAGWYLVVGDDPLDGIGLSPHAEITRRRFRPPSLPKAGNGDRRRLIDRESYRNAAPARWEEIEEMKGEKGAKWLRRMGIRGESYEALFVHHCANHANFIEPLYFIEEEGETVPYAIGRTAQVCSACMEFFDIIGHAFRKKLVVPCPGAVLFAGMAANRYYEVTRRRGSQL